MGSTMVSNSNSGRSKISLLFVFFLYVCPVAAQHWHLTDSIEINTPQAVSLDALGGLYVADTQGKLQKYMPDLTPAELFSSIDIRGLSTLDAGQMLKIFAFYGHSQQFQFFNRYLLPISQPAIIQSGTGRQFEAAAFSSDQMIWLLDGSNSTLLKYHPILEEFILEADLHYYLKSGGKLSQIREYGNRLYLQQDDEIIVLDYQGNYLQKLPVSIAGDFSFFGNRMFFLQDNEIVIYDLNSMEIHSSGISPSARVIFICVGQEAVFLFSDDKLFRYRYLP